MSDFFTMDGYDRQQKRALTRAMEDYLEMICRLSQDDPVVRVQAVAERLNVRPSSVTRMLRQLAAGGYIEYRPYAYLKLREKGREEGAYLLYRHAVLHEFLCALNGTQDELEQVELIEHFLNRRTVENIEALTRAIKSGPPSPSTQDVSAQEEGGDAPL